MTLSATPSQVVLGQGNQTITLRISIVSPWTPGTPGSPTFTLATSGGAGASIVSQAVVNGHQATVVIAPGSTAGLVTLTDPATGQTVVLGVAAGPSSAVVGPLPPSGVGTGIVRAPTIVVTVPGGTVTHVLEASHDLGLDIAVGTATFSVPTIGDLLGATYLSPVAITLSAGSHTATWKGVITEVDYTYWPRRIDVLCSGYLELANRQKNPVTGGTPLATLLGGTGTDEDSVVALLTASGIVDHAPNPPVLSMSGISTIDGTGQIVGQIAPQSYVWAEKETALAFIQRLDEACVGYRTYDDLDGTIWRLQITTVPAGSGVATFTEGVDIFSGESQQTILTAANKIVVTGYDVGAGDGPVTHTATGSNAYIPNPPHYIVEELSSPLIEYALDADRPVGYGLSCEGAATYLLSQYNITQVRLPFVTPRDDVILVGTTITVTTGSGDPDRLGVSGNFYVQHVTRGVDEHGTFQQSLICLAGVDS